MSTLGFPSPHRPPAMPTLFPYTTLFRSSAGHGQVDDPRHGGESVRLQSALADDDHSARPIADLRGVGGADLADRKSTRLNSSHLVISYAVFCLKKATIDTLSARGDRVQS